jgi:hypothetical protein
MREARRTTSSVSAHFWLTPIRIVKTPFEIGFLGSLDQDETICPDRDSPSAHLLDEVFQTIFS